jgi:hypothetical protein
MRCHTIAFECCKLSLIVPHMSCLTIDVCGQLHAPQLVYRNVHVHGYVLIMCMYHSFLSGGLTAHVLELPSEILDVWGLFMALPFMFCISLGLHFYGSTFLNVTVRTHAVPCAQAGMRVRAGAVSASWRLPFPAPPGPAAARPASGASSEALT